MLSMTARRRRLRDPRRARRSSPASSSPPRHAKPLLDQYRRAAREHRQLRGHRAARRAAPARRDGRGAAVRASSATPTTAGAIAARRRASSRCRSTSASSARSTPPSTSATSIRAACGASSSTSSRSRCTSTPQVELIDLDTVAPARPVQGGQRVGRRGAGRRDRSRRPVRRARLARGQRRRELLARSAAQRARDPARRPARRRSPSTATPRSSARATSTRSCCPSSPTTARSSSRRSSTTSCSTTAASKQREDERRLQYILVDCSASMRGQRQVFARGLALALIKKLTLEGDEIWVRFFDSRLHETDQDRRARARCPVPYLLSFRSERGRNYGKVFRQLLVEVTRLRREQKRRVVLYIITHGQCHIEPELVDGAQAAGVPLRHHHLAVVGSAARVRRRCSIASRSSTGDALTVARRAAAPRARHRR